MAAPRDCFDSARLDAAELPSRCKARFADFERLGDGCDVRFTPPVEARGGLLVFEPLLFLVFFGPLLVFFGPLSRTPARRALDKPMAIACWVERAPCLPLRTW